MGMALQNTWLVRDRTTLSTRNKGMARGLMGGTLGTLIMDLLLMGVLPIAGLPSLSCFSTVGDTVARFFSLLGIEAVGGVAFGVAAHYVVGPIIGAIFGIAMTRVEALRACGRRKMVLIAVLYVEIVSQPILALTPILLEMTAADTLQWFAGSFVMHLIWGIVLGVVVSYGGKRSL